MSRITLGIGEKKTVNLSGGRFYYEKGVGRIGVKTIGADSGYFELSPGMGFQNTENMQNFQAVEIANLSTIGQDVEFIVSYREVFDNRVTFGDTSGALGVDLSISGKAQTKSGLAFLHTRYMGGSAGVYSNIALRNPLGSGRNAIVKSIDVAGQVQFEVLLMKAIDIAAVEADAAVTLLNLGAEGSPSANKLVQLSPGVSVCAVDQFASTGGNFSNLVYLLRSYKPALTSYKFAFNEPIVLPPGAGLVVSSWAAHAALSATFETVEELI